MDYRRIVTTAPGKCGGTPCIQGLRITVDDVHGDFACLACAADRERRTLRKPA